MITTVLFDIGDVFFFKDKQKSDEVLRRHGVTEDNLREIKHSDAWKSYKKGDLTEEEGMALIKPLFPETYTENPRELFHDLSCSKTLNSALVPLAYKLKEKYRIAVLSNSNSFLEERLEEFQLMPLFEFVINSYRVRMKKPDEEIFKLAIERLGEEPESVLFVDDKERNTDTAKRLGFQVHTFTDTETFKNDLLDQGWLTPEEAETGSSTPLNQM
ncbi:HAD family hydrolase [Sporolactobacillus pectinivorans]|uniref:HAD family hydrolase n=1 Tax=Sporolactobacillus pectinivorans TaxID=1591408 RepID=UPI000C261615|nr:HAD family phosphatase [Sporolactobacillus pectinivorans]